MFARFRLAAACVALASVTATGAPAIAQGVVANAADPYVHKVAGVEFPENIGKFQRGRVVEYDERGADASVSYGVDGLLGELSVYLYPARGTTCQEQLDMAKTAVLKRGGTTLQENAPAIKLGSFEGIQQKSVTFTVKSGGFGFDHPALVSYLWVGCPAGDNWVVKYRGSFAAADQDKVGAMAEDLFSAIDWSAVTGE